MAGYDIREGVYEDRNISDDEIWSVFSFVFSNQSRNTTSYKFAFLKALLDNLYNVDDSLALDFDQIFSRFAEEYWNLILKYRIRQSPVNINGKRTAIENILYSAEREYDLPLAIPFESLASSVQRNISQKVKSECKRFVVGAFYSDTKRLFYSFSLRTEKLQFSPVFYRFVCAHKVVLEKLNYYEWARYLERVNDDSTRNILSKLDESTKRENLSYYRDILYREFEVHTCFYCGRRITENQAHVDHFIPRSFIKDDNLWNFVISCPHCNTSKSNKLTPRSYVSVVAERNRHIKTHENDMLNYDDSKLGKIYDWAYSNGYDRIWMPKTSCIGLSYD